MEQVQIPDGQTLNPVIALAESNCPFVCLVADAGAFFYYCDSDCDGWEDALDPSPCDPSIPSATPEDEEYYSVDVCDLTFQGHLGVNESVRNACESVATDDPSIMRAIAVVEASRLEGISLEILLSNLFGECSGLDSFSQSAECVNCLTAIGEQVYGQDVTPTTPPSIPVIPPSGPPPDLTPSSLIGAAIVAADGTYLGVIDSSSFSSESIANQFGTFGNRFSSVSIWNQFGSYGSAFSTYSAWNEFTVTPPGMYIGATFIGYLTANNFLSPSVHPAVVAVYVGRTDVLR